MRREKPEAGGASDHRWMQEASGFFSNLCDSAPKRYRLGSIVRIPLLVPHIASQNSLRGTMNPSSKQVLSSTEARKCDAIALLMADHKKVKNLFKQFKKLRGKSASVQEKAALAQNICKQLKVHAQLEREIFYPAVRQTIHDDDLMNEAEVELAYASKLIAQIESMPLRDDQYDAKVIALGEHMEYHVREVEGEIFPKIKRAGIDTATLGAQMLERKWILMEAMSLSDSRNEDTIDDPLRGALHSVVRKSQPKIFLDARK